MVLKLKTTSKQTEKTKQTKTLTKPAETAFHSAGTARMEVIDKLGLGALLVVPANPEAEAGGSQV